MVNFKLINKNINNGDNIIYDIQIMHRISIVVGESSRGKSYLIRLVEDINSGNSGDLDIVCNKRVEAVRSISILKELIENSKETLIILDEDIVSTLRSNKSEVKLKDIVKSPNYFLLLDRQSSVKIDCNVNAVYEFERQGNVGGINAYRAVKHFKLSAQASSNIDVSRYKYFITEDTESGRVFFGSILGKLELVEFETDRKDMLKGGNGAILDILNDDIVNQGVIIALDYDCGAVIMQRIAYTFRNKLDKIGFIPMESFEELICNSEFILDAFPEIKDLVINYEDHMDASVKHSGKYFQRYCMSM